MEAIKSNEKLKQALFIGAVTLLVLAGGIKPVYAEHEVDIAPNQVTTIEYAN